MLYSHVYDFSCFKCFLALVLIFSLVSCSGGDGGDGDGTLSWVAPSERDDGTALSMSEIGGYVVYYNDAVDYTFGDTPGVYKNQIAVDSGSTTSVSMLSLPAGDYFVVITAFDTNGEESTMSEEILISI